MKKNKLFFVILVVILLIATPLLISYLSGDKKIYHEAENDFQQVRQQLNSGISTSRQTIITETVAKINNAVVGINVTEIREIQNPFFSPFFDDPFFRQFFGDRSTRQKVSGLGSGFLISEDGYILTNDHVAGNATQIVVTMTDGKHYDAKIVGTDGTSDICLLKIEGENFPYLKLGNSSDILIAEWVIALGNPFGLFELNDKPTVTVGVVSALGMNLEPVQNRYYMNMIQTDAAINGGNSGGPLVNALGEVIGMNTLIFTAGGSQGNIGLGFAIPINKVKKIVDELKDLGSIKRDFYTGLKVQNIDDAIAKYFNLENTRGVIVTGVQKNSPAADAGIEVGDVIIQLDEFKINNQTTLSGLLQEFRTNQTVTLKVVRGSDTKNLKMKLEKIK
ncbi:MAG: PDZ domain-containing protein [Ignavibacteriales bacterium]|jgi:serine protease Do|nr:trypsin-like peptidase domain-containing protein [Ignavibacteriaceae bacterium]NLH60587.1 PDZ domain-containing protein [Ignavibacteriales bacterium]HOJ17434.1 trypsin-like peptidase domain-containing protein [Ignavibacteriaceae bacterium]HPO54722.1 trypsin-like peptidase domain-containing protein [Ignavibacteriaceae bacterium]